MFAFRLCSPRGEYPSSLASSNLTYVCLIHGSRSSLPGGRLHTTCTTQPKGEHSFMKLATWNVNGIRAAWGNGLADFLNDEKPDLLGIQEVKCQQNDLPPEIHEPEGYRAFWHCGGRPGYSGVAVLVRRSAIDPVWTVSGLGLPEFDREGRVLTVEMPGFFFVTAYFPNSGPGGRRVAYKLEFCRRIAQFCESLRRRGKPVILCGDLNIAPGDIDVYDAQGAAGSAGFLQAERDWLAEFLRGNWVDVFRRDQPQAPDCFTWWSFFDEDRANNRGWRIDSFLVSDDLAPVVKSEHRVEVMGSDHCPVVAEVGAEL